MSITSQAFRQAFPAFLDPNCYPETEIDYWRQLGVKLIDQARWGELFSDGLFLFVAHNLTLEFNSKKAAAKGQTPGQVVGVTTSASVDKVSYSRDASSAMDPEAGHWNLTIYGLRYIRLVKMVGAGPVYVGPSNPGASIAWPGVIPPIWG